MPAIVDDEDRTMATMHDKPPLRLSTLKSFPASVNSVSDVAMSTTLNCQAIASVEFLIQAAATCVTSGRAPLTRQRSPMLAVAFMCS